MNYVEGDFLSFTLLLISVYYLFERAFSFINNMSICPLF